VFEYGLGFAPDYAEAVRWYRLAATQGFAVSQYNLGVMFDCGRGVARDRTEAKRLYCLAAAQGHAEAQGKL
jgi:hypothetical protein